MGLLRETGACDRPDDARGTTGKKRRVHAYEKAERKEQAKKREQAEKVEAADKGAQSRSSERKE